MYYRITVQTYAPPALWWLSDPLGSLPTVEQWLLHVRVFPPERLRVFSSDCCEALDEQLRRANQGLESTSAPATRFLPDRTNTRPVRVSNAAPPPAETGHAVPLLQASSQHQVLTTPVEQRRAVLEQGVGGDHDQVYRFRMRLGGRMVRTCTSSRRSGTRRPSRA
jgi:hypothetical protein